jgi:phosphate transport system substrate-binding protein
MKKRHWALIWALVAVISGASVYYFGFYLRQSDQILLVGGSSTVMRYASALGDGLMKQRGDITVITEGGGSTPALIAIKNQAIDVAVISRELEDDEDDDYTSSNLIARDAIGFYVCPENPVENLTIDQLKAVFTGEVDNWSQLGGADQPVRIVVCGPESASAEALGELLLDGAEAHDTLKSRKATKRSGLKWRPIRPPSLARCT